MIRVNSYLIYKQRKKVKVSLSQKYFKCNKKTNKEELKDYKIKLKD